MRKSSSAVAAGGKDPKAANDNLKAETGIAALSFKAYKVHP